MLCKDCIACNNCKTCEFARLIRYSYGVYSSVMTRIMACFATCRTLLKRHRSHAKLKVLNFDGNGNS